MEVVCQFFMDFTKIINGLRMKKILVLFPNIRKKNKYKYEI